MELRDYIGILRRRWLLIVLCALGAIAAAALFTLQATPQYASTSRVFISTSQSDDAGLAAGGQFSQQRVKSYADLLTGEEISRRVVEALELDQTPRELSEQISAEAKLDTVVLAITVTDPDRDRAQELTQAVSEQFVAYVAEIETPPGQDSAPVKATIVDRAIDPTSPVSPQPARNLALAAILGLMLGAGAAVLRETLDTRIKSTEDIAKVTAGAPLLGNISFDKGAVDAPLVSELSGHSPRSEAFRVLRTNIQFVDVDHSSKLFVVSSALPGEGKTTTACNLAISLADTGQRVLLMESDLRRPRVADYLNLEAAVGLTTILIGKIGLDDAVQYWGPSLEVLTSGATPPNPAELLQSGAMKDLLNECRSKYDVIIIDAPPLLPVTDAALVAAESDGAILVVRHGKTTHDQVEASMDRLSGVGAKLAGTVANMTPKPSSNKYGYGYGYGYGYAPTDAGTSGHRAK